MLEYKMSIKVIWGENKGMTEERNLAYYKGVYRISKIIVQEFGVK